MMLRDVMVYDQLCACMTTHLLPAYVSYDVSDERITLTEVM